MKRKQEIWHCLAQYGHSIRIKLQLYGIAAKMEGLKLDSEFQIQRVTTWKQYKYKCNQPELLFKYRWVVSLIFQLRSGD